MATPSNAQPARPPSLVVLGTAQDGGHPHPGCRRPRCRVVAGEDHFPACLGILDPQAGLRWLLEATPRLGEQLALLDTAQALRDPAEPDLDGIFLSHAHSGHFAGLLQLGREVLAARALPVHAMPQLAAFIGSNEPWASLIRQGNIDLRQLQADRPVSLGADLALRPVLVPHRDELSETVGFFITGPRRQALFLPNIVNGQSWQLRLEEVIACVDRAWIDGTLFDVGEFNGRDEAEVPHPTIRRTLGRLAELPVELRGRVRCIHLNHTHPAFDRQSAAAAETRAADCGIAHQGEVFEL